MVLRIKDKGQKKNIFCRFLYSLGVPHTMSDVKLQVSSEDDSHSHEGTSGM